MRTNLIEGDPPDAPAGETIVAERVYKDKSWKTLLHKVYRGSRAEIDEMLKKDLLELEEQERLGGGQLMER